AGRCSYPEVVCFFASRRRHTRPKRDWSSDVCPSDLGLNTVELDGKGFEILVKKGSFVKKGDSLLNFDIPFLKSENKDIVTPLIITNTSEAIDGVIDVENRMVAIMDSLFVCKLK